MLRNYADERRARSIARRIVERRPLDTTSELVEAVRAGLPPSARFGRGNPAKRTFQAIRIAVNGELDGDRRGASAAWDLLARGGRLAAISFHSHEDRRVKRFLADRARGCVCPPEFPVCRCGLEPEAKLMTRGGIAPSAGEYADNPRSASAHLRVAGKLDRGGDLLMGAPAVTSPASHGRAAGARKPKPEAPRAPRLDAVEALRAPPHAAPRARAPRAAATPARRRSRVTPAAASRCFRSTPSRPAGAVGRYRRLALVVGMTRGRAWIVMLGVLLGGIVALNVWGLSLSASSQRDAVEDRRARAGQQRRAPGSRTASPASGSPPRRRREGLADARRRGHPTT